MEKNLFLKIHALLKSVENLKGLALLLLLCLTTVVGKAEDVELYTKTVTVSQGVFTMTYKGELNSDDKTATITQVVLDGDLDQFGSMLENVTEGIFDLTFPSEVTYNDVTYTVTAIDANLNYSGTVNENNHYVLFTDKNQSMLSLLLKSVTIPSSVKSLGAYNFWFCNNLETVTLNEGLETIGEGCFKAHSPYGSGKLTSVNVPSTVTTIGKQSFMNQDNLTSLTFAENSQLTSIGQQAFDDDNLSSVIIPKTVKSLGNNCFSQNSNLTVVTFEEGSVIETIGDNCFNDDNISSIVIPSTLTSLGNRCFINNSNLTSVTFEDAADEDKSKLTKIGQYCFNGTALTNIILPINLTTIGNYAFSKATSGSNRMASTLKNIILLGGKLDNSSLSTSRIPTTVSIYSEATYTTKNGAKYVKAMLGYRAPGNVYGTVCYPKAISLENSVGVKALYGEKSDEKHGLADDHSLITMTEVTAPVAGTPYIFERSSEDTDDNLVIFVPADATETAVETVKDGTYLKGTYEKTDYASLDSSHGLYIMQKGMFKKMGNSNWLNANTAYLDLGETTAASKPITISFEKSETTGISNALKGNADVVGVKYNLQGQRILKPAAGQIYIMNGRKYIAK